MKTNVFLKYLAAVFAVMLCFSLNSAEIMAAPKAPSKTVLKSVSSPGAGKLKIQWKKVSRAARYQIQIATNKKFTKEKQNKVVPAKKTSVTITGLKKGGKYYVRVRASRTVRSKKYDGKWSRIVYSKTKNTVKKPGSTPVPKEPVKELNQLDIKILMNSSSYPYTGKEITPTVKILYGSAYLTEGRDYTVSYANNVKIGQASVIITGTGKYTGNISKPFTIVKAGSDTPYPTVTPAPVKDEDPVTPDLAKDLSKSGKIHFTGTSTYNYSGKAIQPAIEVTYQQSNGNTYLKEDTDYTVAYSDNINAGTGFVTVTGKGVYTGTITRDFTIEKVFQDIETTLETPTIYVGKTGKASVSGSYGELMFSTSDEGIIEISSDGTITGLRPGQTYIYLNVGGDANHYPGHMRFSVGLIKVISEETDIPTPTPSLTPEPTPAPTEPIKTFKDLTEEAFCCDTENSKMIYVYKPGSSDYSVQYPDSTTGILWKDPDGTAYKKGQSLGYYENASKEYVEFFSIIKEEWEIPYSYDSQILNKHNLYNGKSVWVYIKTDNPDANSITIDREGCTRSCTKPWDVHLTNDESVNYFWKVNGGYITSLQFQESGQHTITVKQQYEEANRFFGKTVLEIPVEIKDYETAKNTWYDKIISEVTNEGMGQKEKIDALFNYVEDNFLYEPNICTEEYPQGESISLISEDGAYFENYRGTCVIFSTIMCNFAERLGIEGAYLQYAGYLYHHYAVIPIDGQECSYDANIPVSTGTIAESDLPYIM